VINKRNKVVELALPASFNQGKVTAVDVSTGENEPVQSVIAKGTLKLKPFGVAIIAF
jgi:hypothetical protein